MQGHVPAMQGYGADASMRQASPDDPNAAPAAATPDAATAVVSEARLQLEALREQQQQYHVWLVQYLESAASAAVAPEPTAPPHGTESDEGDTSDALYAIYASAAGRSYLHCLKVIRVGDTPLPPPTSSSVALPVCTH